MAIYGLAALACLLALAGRLPWLVALIWAATIAPGGVGARGSAAALQQSRLERTGPAGWARVSRPRRAR